MAHFQARTSGNQEIYFGRPGNLLRLLRGAFSESIARRKVLLSRQDALV